MSDQPNNPSNIPPIPPIPSVDEIRQNLDEALRNQPPEVQQAVEKSKSFYAENKNLIKAGIVTVVCLKVYKRKIAKTTAKQVVKALAKQQNQPLQSYAVQAAPTMFDVLNDLKALPNMVYIPHGGGMAHLKAVGDAIVTVFGDNLDDLSNEQIRQMARVAIGYR